MRILLVEDDRHIARQVAEGLGAAGYLVETTPDGDEAWFRGETETFDAVILDIGLPKLDGLSILKRWRGAGMTTPVLLLTARGTWMERVEGIDSGADDYIAKPFHMEELASRLDAVLRRSAGHAAPLLQAGAVAIDTRRMIVTLAGTRIDLPPREFLLLRYLVHHRGRVVTQVEIEDHIYDRAQEPESNAVESLVKRLRRKLGADIIETRRGFGYVIEG
jgi:two-component system OmpR family response regulator